MRDLSGTFEYGLLGRKLGHSYSPQIHAMLGDYRYELIEAEPDEVKELFRARRFKGLNVTIPYKKDACALCDALTDAAKLTGSVNTVVNENGYLTGHNTDFDGFVSMLRKSGVPIEGKKAAVLGGGGSGVMAVSALQSLGARPVPVSRSGPVTYEKLYVEHADIELLVNATPVGMYPKNGETPVDLSPFGRLEGVFDLIYNPCRTALLLDAEERSIPARNGLWMLIAQARRAAELFTGGAIGEDEIARVHARLRGRTENISLIGMPGCGKSSVGRILAESMNRAFVDLDEEIARREGRTIPAIFAEEGENYFRDLESAMVAEYGREKELVIATGGGAVLRHENMRALKQNGEIFFIERPIDLLETDGRPLSKGKEELSRMAEARLPLYRKYGARAVGNTGSVTDAARAVEEGFYEITGY